MSGNGHAIIIKKVKKGGHEGGHHGGAWKVAYADFVTAMMAFFLLLWLLNVTTDIQKRGIADYFQATLASQSHSGAGGVLGGVSIGQPGAEVVPSTIPSMADTAPTLPPASTDQDDEDDDPNRMALGKGGTATQRDTGDSPGNGAGVQKDPEKAKAEQVLRAIEKKEFDAAQHALRQAIEDVPGLKQLGKNLLVDQTPEGLRIQIVDQGKTSMFPLGSATMTEPARKLMALIAQVVQKLPNQIAITGHTDATPYTRDDTYGNWELSTDRADASRRELIGDGVLSERIARVAGVAERDPLVPADPTSPRNRRISIVLLRQAPVSPAPRLAQR
jgi:chemotaxis protein MotB